MPRSVVAVQGCHAQNGSGDHPGPCPDQGKEVVVGGGGGSNYRKCRVTFEEVSLNRSGSEVHQ